MWLMSAIFGKAPETNEKIASSEANLDQFSTQKIDMAKPLTEDLKERFNIIQSIIKADKSWESLGDATHNSITNVTITSKQFISPDGQAMIVTISDDFDEW